MMWNVEFSSGATKFIRKLDEGIKRRVKVKFSDLAEDPFRFLKHYEGDYYKFRIGDFRALIRLDFDRRIIFVDVFDKRGRIYGRQG